MEQHTEVIVQLISPAALATWMTFRGQTCATVARYVEDHSGKQCARSTIGHLRSGFRSYCDPERARLIEKALDVPAGSLFVPRLVNVSRPSTGKRAKSQAAA